MGLPFTKLKLYTGVPLYTVENKYVRSPYTQLKIKTRVPPYRAQNKHRGNFKQLKKLGLPFIQLKINIGSSVKQLKINTTGHPSHS